MTYRKSLLLLGLVIIVGAVVFVGVKFQRLRNRLGQLAPPRSTDRPANTSGDDAQLTEHPLDPALKIANKCLENIEKNVQDYSATLIKRERVDGKLLDEQQLRVKIRNKPFAAYTYFLVPENLKGQEALYIEGKNGGNMLAHGVGLQGLIGVVSLKPDGLIAMQGQRYPITEIGVLNLAKRLIEVAEEDRQHGECEVTITHDFKIDDRPCTCIEVVHPKREPYFRFYKALVCIDDEMDIPVRYQAYDWPAKPGDEPPLLEAYTYIDVKLNNDFTDADFDFEK